MTIATFVTHIYRTSHVSVFTRVRYFSIAVILLVLATTVVRGEQVLLGDPALTAGVPGNGPISVPQSASKPSCAVGAGILLEVLAMRTSVCGLSKPPCLGAAEKPPVDTRPRRRR